MLGISRKIRPTLESREQSEQDMQRDRVLQFRRRLGDLLSNEQIVAALMKLDPAALKAADDALREIAEHEKKIVPDPRRDELRNAKAAAYAAITEFIDVTIPKRTEELALAAAKLDGDSTDADTHTEGARKRIEDLKRSHAAAFGLPAPTVAPQPQATTRPVIVPDPVSAWDARPKIGQGPTVHHDTINAGST